MLGTDDAAKTLPTEWSIASSRGGRSAGQRIWDAALERKHASAAGMRQERDARWHRQLGKPGQQQVATLQEQEHVSTLLNRRVAELFPDAGARGWYKLFKWMDDDGSGKISYAELEDMVRNELRVAVKDLGDDKLKAVWRALDEDGSGLITGGEFGHFMRKGDHVHKTGKGEPLKVQLQRAKVDRASGLRQERGRLAAERQGLLEATRVEKHEVVSSVRTAMPPPGEPAQALRSRNAAAAAEMRRARDERWHRGLGTAAAGGKKKVASAEEQEQVSVMLNKRMKQLFPTHGGDSWYSLFRWMDDDSSGKISYAELFDMIRNELRVNVRELSNEQLQGVWLALDADGSGLITSGEFGHFMRKGDFVHAVQEPSKNKVFQATAEKASTARGERKECLRNLHDTLCKDDSRKRERAQHAYDVLWGLRPAYEQKPWQTTGVLPS